MDTDLRTDARQYSSTLPPQGELKERKKTWEIQTTAFNGDKQAAVHQETQHFKYLRSFGKVDCEISGGFFAVDKNIDLEVASNVAEQGNGFL